MMDRVLILQTCDGNRYKPLLDATERWHRHYARQHGYDYLRVDGVVYGFKPWHAAFNRIFLLQDILQKAVYDWVLYMDADAVIVDGRRGVEEFLDDARVLVACRGATDDPNIWYNINNGIFFINMRHPQTSGLLAAWRGLLEAVPKQVMQNEPDGIFNDESKHVNDQDMLCQILFDTPGFKHSVKVYRGEHHNAFNYHGPFMQQILRSEGLDMQGRVAKLTRLAQQAGNACS